MSRGLRIFLIQPANDRRRAAYREGLAKKVARETINRFSRIKLGGGKKIPPFALMVLAALTPPEHEVFIIDEYVQEIDFDVSADLVGITLLTPTALRAYDIADRFRERGVVVVLGGVHATVLPEEAARHADAVVVGEAEYLWGDLLADAGAGRLKPFYRSDSYCSMKGLPRPRWDLLRTEGYLSTNLVQTTRGCPNRCSFCSVHSVAGMDYRCRPVEEVVDEIRSLPYPLALFVDDNIAGRLGHARELFEKLIPLKIGWTAQSSLRIAEDDEMLKLAARSGCRFLLVGFESLSDENIRKIGKWGTNRVADYEKQVRKIHDHGIGVVGTFILGLDSDGPESFPGTVEFIRRNRIECPSVGLLTPYPGSRLFKAFDEEGRLLHKNWIDYSHMNGRVVYQPRRMTPDELEAGHRLVGKEIFSMGAMAGRVWRARGRLPAAAWNFGRRGDFFN